LFNIFVVIGKAWRTIIGYEVPNGVGKMNTKVYTEQVLPQLLEKFNTKRITLCQDVDLAHRSRATIKWAKDYDLDLLTLPGSLPIF
jgi:hypothetical protein